MSKIRKPLKLHSWKRLSWMQLWWVAVLSLIILVMPGTWRLHLALNPYNCWYGVLTAIFVHAGLVHYLSNMLFMFLLSWVVIDSFDKPNLTWPFLISALIANCVVADMILKTPGGSLDDVLGASGGVTGLFGMGAVGWIYDVIKTISEYRKGNHYKPKHLHHLVLKLIILFITSVAYLNVTVLVFIPSSLVIHVSGALVGAVYGVVFVLVRHHEAKVS